GRNRRRFAKGPITSQPVCATLGRRRTPGPGTDGVAPGRLFPAPQQTPPFHEGLGCSFGIKTRSDHLFVAGAGGSIVVPASTSRIRAKTQSYHQPRELSLAVKPLFHRSSISSRLLRSADRDCSAWAS